MLYILGNITPTIEGLYLTQGNATGLGGDTSGWDAGGGIYVLTATATIKNNQILQNSARLGGGLYLLNSDATLMSNKVFSNSTSGPGGGIYFESGNVILAGNQVYKNTGGTFGGGVTAWFSHANIEHNIIANNSAGTGGGLYSRGEALINSNTFSGNVANNGGGIYIYYGQAILLNNQLIFNTANQKGGGGYTHGSDIVFTNTVIANNAAYDIGEGFHIQNCSPKFIHTTIVGNNANDGSGINITWNATVMMTNTIVSDQNMGIVVAEGNTVTVNSILWHNTPITVSQASTAVVSIQNQYTGDPAFAPDSYHITSASAALDKGVPTQISTDIDGELRPQGIAPDLGADEIGAAALPEDMDDSPERSRSLTAAIRNGGREAGQAA